MCLALPTVKTRGVTGVEASYNDYLSGTPGKLVTAKNARGVDMPFQYEQLVEAQDGYSLVLTIDEVVQHFLEKSVEEAAESCQARNRACGIVMNVNTGEILAMTVKGDYDPNDPIPSPTRRIWRLLQRSRTMRSIRRSAPKPSVPLRKSSGETSASVIPIIPVPFSKW